MIDQSWVVTKKNFYKAFKHELKVSNNSHRPDSPRLIGHVLGLAGLRARHIKGDMTFNRACKVLEDMETDAPEQLKTVDTMAYSIIFNPIDQVRGIAISQNVVPRYQMLDVERAAMLYHDSYKFPERQSAFVNLYDPQGVQEIAAKEYDAYPINISDL